MSNMTNRLEHAETCSWGFIRDTTLWGRVRVSRYPWRGETRKINKKQKNRVLGALEKSPGFWKKRVWQFDFPSSHLYFLWQGKDTWRWLVLRHSRDLGFSLLLFIHKMSVKWYAKWLLDHGQALGTSAEQGLDHERSATLGGWGGWSGPKGLPYFFSSSIPGVEKACLRSTGAWVRSSYLSRTTNLKGPTTNSKP